MHIKRFNTFLKIWVQFRMDAIPRPPTFTLYSNFKIYSRFFMLISKYIFSSLEII